jgi:hypothetical protein
MCICQRLGLRRVFGSCPIGHNVLTSTARAASSSTSGELPALGGVNLPILKLHALLGLELPPLPYERVDHAWFVGFAPAAKPRIAFAVLVEHGGHGGSVAAPVAVEIVENYFDTVVPPDERNPPRVSHRGERRLSATADKPAPEAHVAVKPALAPASGAVPPSSTEASGGQ